MTTDRKLKDYPQIPSTPPPSEKKDKGLVSLEDEYEYEKKYLHALCMENKELEEILKNLDEETAFIRSHFPEEIAGDGKIHASNDHWLKYESQMEQNRKLEREKKSLQCEIKQIEKQGLVNLDSLTQSELILYVRQLERTKTNLQSDLRSKEWGLDKQARDIHHLNEMKRALQAEIRHYDKEFAMFRHYKKNSCPSASPTYNRGSYADEDRKGNGSKRRERSKSEEPEKVKQKHKSEPVEEARGGAKSDIMFSSLDESKLEKMECEPLIPGFQRTKIKGSVSERSKVDGNKKGTSKKTVVIGSLPELSKNKPAGATVSKSKRIKIGNKVGTESPKPLSPVDKTNKPIQIIVTYETQRTTVAELQKKNETQEKEKDEEKLNTFRSVEEVYEDDFEESDVERSDRKMSGFLTTRV